MRQNLYNYWKNALEERKLMVLDYLENKYHKRFEIVGAMGEGWGQASDRFHAKPSGGNDDEVFAIFGRQTMQNYCLSDAYYSVLIHPAYTAFAANLAEHIHPHKVWVILNKESPNPGGLTADVPVKDIYRFITPGEPIFNARINLLVPRSALNGRDPADVLKHYAEPIARTRLMAWIKLYTVDDIDFNDLNLDNVLMTSCPITCYTGRDYTLRFLIERSGEATPVFKTEATTPSAEPLSDWQLERLCALVYLDGLLLHREEGSLGEIMDYLLTYGFEDCKINGRLPCEMTAMEWLSVLNSVRSDPALCALRIVKCEDITEVNTRPGEALPGHRAVCFADCSGHAYVIFRGTCGDEEWHDNAIGMLNTETVQQQAAAQFILAVRADRGIQRLTAAGHSKGGNKAQYVTVVMPEGCVDDCLSLDGQGFSYAFMDQYGHLARSRAARIRRVAERRDFVNALGLSWPSETRYYSGRRGDVSPDAPHGEALPLFHCPDALRNRDGQVGAESFIHPIADLLHQLTSHFLIDARYTEHREETTVNLMALMMKKKQASVEQLAEALTNFIVVFMDLACQSKDFRDIAESVIMNESDVLLATFEVVAPVTAPATPDILVASVTPDAPDSPVTPVNEAGGLAKTVAEQLAGRIAADPTVRRDFIGMLRHVIKLVQKLLAEGQAGQVIMEHIFVFVERLLKNLAGSLLRAVSRREMVSGDRTEGAVPRLLLACWRGISSRTQKRYYESAELPEKDDFAPMLAYLDEWKPD